MLLTCLTICAVQMVAVIKALMASAFQEPVTQNHWGRVAWVTDIGSFAYLLCYYCFQSPGSFGPGLPMPCATVRQHDVSLDSQATKALASPGTTQHSSPDIPSPELENIWRGLGSLALALFTPDKTDFAAHGTSRVS